MDKKEKIGMKKEKCYVCGKTEEQLMHYSNEQEVSEDRRGKAICSKCWAKRVVEKLKDEDEMEVDAADRSWKAYRDEAVKALRRVFITDDKKNDSL
jgi:hypothetical protein